MPGDRALWTSRSKHRPPHVYVAGLPHMVTAATLHHRRFLAAPERKGRVLEVLWALCEQFGVQVIAWVVLDDHYHAILVPANAPDLPAVLDEPHHTTAAEFNKEDGTPGRQVWHAHWDTRLYTEGDIYSRVNYIHRNPVKHGYVDQPGKWPWSSWHVYYEADDPEVRARLERFRAPLKLPGD